MESLFSVILTIVSITMIITFFIMASRLKKIENILDMLIKIEMKKPVNRAPVICSKCQTEYTVSVLNKDNFVPCPSCNALNKTIK
jgi:hypothetical protein